MKKTFRTSKVLTLIVSIVLPLDLNRWEKFRCGIVKEGYAMFFFFVCGAGADVYSAILCWSWLASLRLSGSESVHPRILIFSAVFLFLYYVKFPSLWIYFTSLSCSYCLYVNDCRIRIGTCSCIIHCVCCPACVESECIMRFVSNALACIPPSTQFSLCVLNLLSLFMIHSPTMRFSVDFLIRMSSETSSASLMRYKSQEFLFFATIHLCFLRTSSISRIEFGNKSVDQRTDFLSLYWISLLWTV